MDFFLGGHAHGDVAGALMRNNMDTGALRPWLGQDGRSFITINQNGKPASVPLNNAVATLRKDEWIQLDQAIVRAAKQRLRAVADLVGAGLQFRIPDGMGKTILQTETQSDINEATIDMDGLALGDGDRPQFNLLSLPLPITHKSFGFSMRQILASRSGGSPLDTTTAELAGRRVAEEVERLLLGITDFSWAGGSIKGYTNHANRNTKTLTAPTASGWTGAKTLTEVLDMRLKSQNDNHFGPWMLYCAPNWDVYMDGDYATAKGDNTLRQRLRQIEGIIDVRTLDYLTAYTLVLVQMTADVVRMVNGMDITTVQWETHGGLMQNFKVMTIMVPQLRADYNNNMGLVHGS